MKNSKIIISGSITILTVFLSACSKDEIQETERRQEITGFYTGFYSNVPLSVSHDSAAQADIIATGDGEISVHCFGEALDTTFVLNYYEHNDSVMVRLTGEEFEHVYGHMLGSGHMMGGMMGDKLNSETEWMHHLDDEHKEGDEHYGWFDMMDHTFGYRFQMIDGDSSYMLDFQGSKSH
ncbi:MAG: hypothetical protein HQ543_02285 [Bacteroidetes bacterium]|nr:hypothetical protein [Bacteroidota bacterium]